jgi:hypothetical protein
VATTTQEHRFHRSETQASIYATMQQFILKKKDQQFSLYDRQLQFCFFYLFVCLFFEGVIQQQRNKKLKKQILEKTCSGFLIMEEMIQVTLIQFTPSEQLTCNLLVNS